MNEHQPHFEDLDADDNPDERLIGKGATMVLFELERQIMLGNIPIEVLMGVIQTAYNSTWGEDTVQQ